MPTATPPEGLAFDRIPTQAGEALVMWDRDLRLRVFDWAGYEPRMRRLLERHYGPVEPKEAAAPKSLKTALNAYFDGDLTSLDTIECATGGTPFQRTVWAALRTCFAWERLPRPMAIVRKQVRLPIEDHDLSALAPGDQQGALRRIEEDFFRRGFDLTRAPLLRLALIRIDADTHRLAALRRALRETP